MIRPDRVLVTGGAGFIGHHLVARLLDSGRVVTVVDDLSTGSLAHLPDHPRLRVVTRSVLDDAALRDAARDVAAVYHLAGVVGMRLVARQGAHAFTVAQQGTRHVLDATGDAPVVLVSSSAVYGLGRSGPVSESVPVTTSDALAYDGGTPGYAAGKLELERLGQQAAAAGRRVLIVRPFNVVGRGQTEAYGMVLPTFLRRAAAGESLVVHGDGTQVRSFCDVATFVDCLLRLAGEPRAWAPAINPINVGRPEAIAILDLARLVLAVTGAAAPIRYVPYGEVYPGRTDVAVRLPDVSRLESLLGPVAWPPLEGVVRQLAALSSPPRPLPTRPAPPR